MKCVYLLFYVGIQHWVFNPPTPAGPSRRAKNAPAPHPPPGKCGVVDLPARFIPVTDLRVNPTLQPVRAYDAGCVIVVRSVSAEGRYASTGLIVEEY